MSLLYLHIFFIGIILSSCFFLILSRNPVYSVLSLIIIFFSSTSILILFGIDFISLLFIIIYVGAIAVLFLFVVMMLDIKNYEANSYNLYKGITFYGIFSFLLIFSIYNSNYLELFNKNFNFTKNFDIVWDSLFGIDVFGQTLYNNFISCFLIAGLILLVAMLGAIVLTLKFRSDRRNELTLKQLSRTDNSLSYLKK